MSSSTWLESVSFYANFGNFPSLASSNVDLSLMQSFDNLWSTSRDVTKFWVLSEINSISITYDKIVQHPKCQQNMYGTCTLPKLHSKQNLARSTKYLRVWVKSNILESWRCNRTKKFFFQEKYLERPWHQFRTITRSGCELLFIKWDKKKLYIMYVHQQV